jgi:hypothetical protein
MVIAFLYTVGYAIGRLPEDYYSFLNGMLFFLTAIYVWLTLRILKDNQKSREIEFIERQLEKLYYPLKDALLFNNFPGNISRDQLREGDCRPIDNIIPYQYLIENETRGKLSRYIDIFISMQKMDVPKAHLILKSEELFQAIEKDIKYLNNQLDELTH